MKSMVKQVTCILCQRETDLTFHHLIPRKLHRRTFYRQNYTKSQLNEGIKVCRLCHRGLHALYDEATLAKQFSTLNAILADEAICRHVDWVRKQRISS